MRRSDRTKRSWIALTALACLFVACDGKGPDPEPVKYNVYYGSSDQGHLYVLDADSLTIIDSIPGLDEVTGIAVSPDGAWIYAESGKPPGILSLKKVNMKTKEIVGMIPDDVFSTVSALGEGRMLIRGRGLCRQDIVDANTFALTEMLDDSICGMRGPASGTSVVAYVGGTSRFRSLDITTGELKGEYIPHLESGQVISVFDAVLHQDGVRVLILGTAHPFWSWFVVGDLETGETLLQHQVFYAQGQIALSDDGSFAVVTDPSN